jgi:hypothetical protein
VTAQEAKAQAQRSAGEVPGDKTASEAAIRSVEKRPALLRGVSLLTSARGHGSIGFTNPNWRKFMLAYAAKLTGNVCPEFRLFAGRRRAIAVMAMVIAAPLYGQDIHPWLAGSGGAIYYNGGNVGVGTSSPTQPLEVNAKNPGGWSTGGVTIDGGGDNGSYTALQLSHVDVRGSYTTPWTSSLVFNGVNTSSIPTANGGLNGALQFYTANAQTIQLGTSNAARMTILSSGNVGIGTTNPTHKLAVNGTIRTREVVVDTGWADYVFEPEYRVKPLSEVHTYIQQHRRLPDMPSAEEVREKGVGLGEMQVKLLAKIEELTLQMIQMDRRNQELQARVVELESRRAQ